jgi:hypothetical protein
MIKISLPSSDVSKAIMEAKEDSTCMAIQGFFLKYDIKFNRLNIEITPKSGKFDPSDVFQLAWYVKEYM